MPDGVPGVARGLKALWLGLRSALLRSHFRRFGEISSPEHLDRLLVDPWLRPEDLEQLETWAARELGGERSSDARRVFRTLFGQHRLSEDRGAELVSRGKDAARFLRFDRRIAGESDGTPGSLVPPARLETRTERLRLLLETTRVLIEIAPDWRLHDGTLAWPRELSALPRARRDPLVRTRLEDSRDPETLARLCEDADPDAFRRHVRWLAMEGSRWLGHALASASPAQVAALSGGDLTLALDRAPPPARPLVLESLAHHHVA